MPERDWEALYEDDDLPWDQGRADDVLVDTVEAGIVKPGAALDIGCGTGTNALWLASRGFDVLGVDIARGAIEQAEAKRRKARVDRCRFERADIFAGEVTGAFDFVFDRGCFHTFDDAARRAELAARVAELLAPGGVWLSLIGSTEGAPRDVGPPRRSARDIAAAIEPVLEIVTLQAIVLTPEAEQPPRAWSCLSRLRSEPAQPSTGQ